MNRSSMYIALLGQSLKPEVETLVGWLRKHADKATLCFERALVSENSQTLYAILRALSDTHADAIFEAINKIDEDQFISLNPSNPESLRAEPLAAPDSSPNDTLSAEGRFLDAALRYCVSQDIDALHIPLSEGLPHRATPEIVEEASCLEELAYDEAIEMYSLRAGSITSELLRLAEQRSLELALHDLCTEAMPCTRISPDASPDAFGVRALVVQQSMALLNLQHPTAFGQTQGLASLLAALEQHAIYPQFISYSLADDTCSLALDSSQSSQASSALTQLNSSWQAHTSETSYSAISIIGSHMRHRSGVSGKIFETLGKNGVSVAAIAQSSSERSISVLIKDSDTHKALHCLYAALFLSARSTLHLLLIGPGSIGSELLQQIEAQEPDKSATRTRLRVVGIANRSSSLLDAAGIKKHTWDNRENNAASSLSLSETIERFAQMNLPNSVVIDCTASAEVPKHYSTLLAQSISVVTPNKRGLSDSLLEYQNHRATARRHNAKWYYETTVGAGLPIIGTLHDLIGSGDSINRIEAVLSGTLSYLWNSYDASQSFSSLVYAAQQQGITEPDPRDDLNGADVARKLLILARESGQTLEMQDVVVHPPIPEECFNTGSIEEFYESLEKAEPQIAERYTSALQAGKRLRYLAILEEGCARVALQEVTADHPSYALRGSDNILSITTRRYHNQPLVIRGPGAGVSVTAAGVLADILRVASYLE